jgi:hypothetical protein
MAFGFGARPTPRRLDQSQEFVDVSFPLLGLVGFCRK